jgi:hypothetical protein
MFSAFLELKMNVHSSVNGQENITIIALKLNP